MILPVIILFLACCIYYLYCECCNKGRYYYSISNVIANIYHLIMKIKDLIENIWGKFKRNTIKWLGVVFQLATGALSLDLGDANIWKVWCIASFAILATLCYCFKVCVEMKRAQLTPTCHYARRRNNKKVWFFTRTHGLEILLCLSCLFLAYAYFMELYSQNHHTHENWKRVASFIKQGIGLVSCMITTLSVCKIYYVTTDDQNKVIPISTIDNFPCYWNERILSEMPPRDVENPDVPDANAAEKVHGDVEDQAVADNLQRDVENPAVPDANAAEMVHRDVEDQAVADALQRDVENQPIADQPEMVQQDDADNPSYADANVQLAAT